MAYVGLLLLLVGGIWAGIYAGFFGSAGSGRRWPSSSIIAVAMYAVATPFFKRLRVALGQRVMGTPKDAPDPVAAPDGEIVAIAASAPAMALNVIGFVGLLVILWLMVVKPF